MSSALSSPVTSLAAAELTEESAAESAAIAPWRDRLYTFEEYLEFDPPDGLCYELEDGKLIPMSVVTKQHETLSQYLFYRLEEALLDLGQAGLVVGGSLGVQTGPKNSRIPDVMVFTAEGWQRLPGGTQSGVVRWDDGGMSLVAEVVSSERRRDYKTKRRDYAAAGIPVYVLLDPRDQIVRVHSDPDRLEGEYQTVQDFRGNEEVRLPLFPTIVLTADDLLNPPLVIELRQQARRDRQVLAEQAEQERQRAEEERQRAEEERQRAEEERLRAEQEHQRAEQERQRAEQERQRADRLAALLRAQGIVLEETEEI